MLPLETLKERPICETSSTKKLFQMQKNCPSSTSTSFIRRMLWLGFIINNITTDNHFKKRKRGASSNCPEMEIPIKIRGKLSLQKAYRISTSAWYIRKEKLLLFEFIRTCQIQRRHQYLSWEIPSNSVSVASMSETTKKRHISWVCSTIHRTSGVIQTLLAFPLFKWGMPLETSCV